MSFATSPEPASPPPEVPRRIYVHAGFWWRVLAYCLDFAILVVLLVAPVMVYGLSAWRGPLAIVDPDGTQSVLRLVPHAWAASGTGAWTASGHGVVGHLALRGLVTVLTVLYFVLFESSRLQATPGKLACRLRVTDLAGRRISFWRALGRYVAKVLAWLTVIGVLMVGWTRRKRGLHDLIAGTLVLRATHADPVVFVPPQAR